MGDSDSTTHHTATAAARLRLLAATRLTPQPSAPDGPSRTPGRHGAPPLNLGVLDQIARTADEIDTLLAAFGDTHPRTPHTAEGIYAHLDAACTRLGLDEHRARQRDALVIRQSLQHALAAGHEDAIRRHRCLDCRCWSLFWDTAEDTARCANRHCAERRGGRHAAFTLAQLAEHAVQETPARRAT